MINWGKTSAWEGFSFLRRHTSISACSFFTYCCGWESAITFCMCGEQETFPCLQLCKCLGKSGNVVLPSRHHLGEDLTGNTKVRGKGKGTGWGVVSVWAGVTTYILPGL